MIARYQVAAGFATIVWGLTYIITTTVLPPNPIFIGAVRASGAALALVLLAREVPARGAWGRIVVLGTLNAGLAFGLFFVAALRMPGGVAATFQAFGPLFTILLAWPILAQPPSRVALASVVVGAFGVALVVLRSDAQVDAIGVAAAFGSAASVSLGTVLVSTWYRQMSLIGFTGWQLVVAGVELWVVALLVGDVPAVVTPAGMLGLAFLAFVTTAFAFALWFWAIRAAGASAVAPFILLVPITAFVMDALFHGIVPTPLQALGAVLVMGSLIASQRATRRG